MWWTDYWPMHWMFAGPLLFFAACALFMFLMMRGMPGHRHGGRAQRILRERFARGEINKAEFEELRQALQD